MYMSICLYICVCMDNNRQFGQDWQRLHGESGVHERPQLSGRSREIEIEGEES